jgi:hypothetical protein
MKIKNIIFSGLFCCKSENLTQHYKDPKEIAYIIDVKNEFCNEYIKSIDQDFEIPKEKNLENLLDFYKKEIEQIKLYYYNSYKNLIESNILEEHREKISIKLKEKESKLIEILLKEIENLNLKNNSNNDNETKKILVGNISSRKSRLINFLFDTKKKTRREATTNKISEVYSNDKVKIYDSPEFHNDFDDLNLNIIKNICNFDQVYILHKDGNFNELVMKIISKIFHSKDIFLVITDCYSSSSEECEEDITEYIKKCTKVLKSLGIDIKEDQIFKTDAKTGGFDNEKLKESLLS